MPLKPTQKILVVGKSADNIGYQTGGWSLTWQGADNKNSDFPNADSVLAGIVAVAGKSNVTFRTSLSENSKDIDVTKFDAVIAVVGEKPYAEGQGDITASGTLRHTERYPEDLSLLQSVAHRGPPVITIFLSGRPLYVNDLLNLSDSFVAAWLPGTEAKGISDVLFTNTNGRINYNFVGKLSFSWPKDVCQTSLNIGDENYAPLFPLNYGLRYGDKKIIGNLPETYQEGGCSPTKSYPIFTRGDRATYPLRITNKTSQVVLTPDLDIVMHIAGIDVEATQIKTQEDARLITWNGPATFEAYSAHAHNIPAFAIENGALKFDTLVTIAPQAKVIVSMDCGENCKSEVDVTKTMANFAGKKRQTLIIPLSCFFTKSVDLTQVHTPFGITTVQPFSAAFANIEIVGGLGKDASAFSCDQL